MDTQRYNIYIGSGELYTWLGRSENVLPDLYVEIRRDGALVQRTGVIKQTKSPSWEEGLCMLAITELSVLTFSLKHNIFEDRTQDETIGRVDIVLHHLLAACTNDTLVSAEFKSMTQPELPSIGFVTVKLEKMMDTNDEAAELSGLGESMRFRYERLGVLSDLEASVVKLQQSVQLSDVNDPDLPRRLIGLGAGQHAKFERLDNLVDLQDSITNLRAAAKLVGDLLPDKAICLSNLGSSLHSRWERLGLPADGEEAIQHLQMAVNLTTDGHLDKAKYLSNLGQVQNMQYERLGHPAVLETSVSNLRKAVNLTFEGHPDKAIYLGNAGNALRSRFEYLGELTDLNESLGYLEKAVKLTYEGDVDKPTRLSNLAICQHSAYKRLGQLVHIDNSIHNLQDAVQFTANDHPNKPMFMSGLGCSMALRFERLGDHSDLEGCIENLQNAVDFTDSSHPNKPIYVSNLANSRRLRYEILGEIADLDSSISHLQEAAKLMDDQNPNKPGQLSNLGISLRLRYTHVGDPADLDAAITNQKNAVDLDNRPTKSAHLFSLAVSQRVRYLRLGHLASLEDSILSMQTAVDLDDDGLPQKANHLIHLGLCHQTRFEHLSEVADLRASISSFREAARSKTAYPHHALLAARKWAEILHLNGDLESASEGYRVALEFLPKVAWLGFDAPSRQQWLVQEKAEDLGCLAASCSIQLGRFEEAVELLDLSRSVFWQQASSLRSDLDVLKAEVPKLAEQLEDVGRQLDAGNFSAAFTPLRSQTTDAHRSAEDIGMERRRLVDEWEKLLERVRQVPKLENFLRPTPFRQLREAVTTGHVVVINTSQYGVDALIFDSTHPIAHVPLLSIDIDTLADLSGDMLLKRPVNPTEGQQQRYVRSYIKPALRVVWNDIILPLFLNLQIPLNHLSTAPKNHIWWYVTGPLTFIPIHAAGTATAVDAVDVSRLVISSYITTLSSLFQAKRKKERTGKCAL